MHGYHPGQMNSWLHGVLSLALVFSISTAFGASGAKAQFAGRDGTATIAATVTINKYARLTTADITPGATSFTVDNITNLRGDAPYYAQLDLGAGDLLILYQAQGATLNGSDSPMFGSVTDIASAGNWEFVVVGSVAGNVITVHPTLMPGGIARSYTLLGRTQVIRVPQYTAFTVSAGARVEALPWDGNVGGVVAIAVSGDAIVDGVISATGRGFRGGIADNANSGYNQTTYRTPVDDAAAHKGEGIGGFTTQYDALGGRNGRGAAANGGGGGNAHNGGGGGGANGGDVAFWTGHGIMDSHPGWAVDPWVVANANTPSASPGGGRGGYSYGGSDRDVLIDPPGDTDWGGDNRRELGGLGGRPVPNDPVSRVFLGGGGGAGDGNNNGLGAGGAGGGLVLLFARAVSGSGEVRANGSPGANALGSPVNCCGDAPGGGGAGGTIVISALTATGIGVSASGGVGGNQIGTNGGTESEGPGGGGSGGYVSVDASIVPFVLGAVSGTTDSPATTEWPQNGASNGARGLTDSGIACTALTLCPLDLTTRVDIVTPVSGTRAREQRPLIAGTTEPGSTVEVFIDTFSVATFASPTGNWSYMPASDLSEGSHTFRADAVDAFGNTASDSHTYIVDRTVLVSIDAPSDGGAVGNVRPAVSGTADPDAELTITITGAGGPFNFMVTVPNSGVWSVTPPADLTESVYAVSVAALDDLGNAASAMTSFMVDLSVVVDIVSPTSGATVGTARPTISGAAEVGSTVQITVDGNPVGGPILIDGSGIWSVTVGSDLTDDFHTIVATARDLIGNMAMDTHMIFVDGTTSIDVQAPTDGMTVMTLRPVISGIAEPGVEISVSVDGNVVGTTVADGTTGVWSITPSANLSQGNHTAVGTATDASGNTATDSVMFRIDTGTSVEITSPAAGVTIANARPTITGNGEPDAVVTIRIDGSVIGMATVGSDGRYSVPVASDLPDGIREVVADIRDVDGNTASAMHRFTVDTVTRVDVTGPVRTTSTTPTIVGTGEPGATITVSIDGGLPLATTVDASGDWSIAIGIPLSNGPHTIVANATDSVGNTATDTLTTMIDPSGIFVDITSPTDGSTLISLRPTVSGTSVPGAAVTLRIDGVDSATGTVRGDGTYDLVPTTDLVSGSRTITVVATMGAATANAMVTVTIPVGVLAVDITEPAEGSSTSARPTIRGTAPVGATVTIFIDGTMIGTATAGADSRFALAAPSDLSEGAHVVRALAVLGPAMGEDSNNFRVDLSTTVAITGPTMGSTVPASSTITGTGEPGALIVVRVDGTTVGTTTVGLDGRWTVTPTSPLAVGARAAEATATDTNGNSAMSTVTFMVVAGSSSDAGVPDAGTPGMDGSVPRNDAAVVADARTDTGTVTTPDGAVAADGSVANPDGAGPARDAPGNDSSTQPPTSVGGLAGGACTVGAAAPSTPSYLAGLALMALVWTTARTSKRLKRRERR